MYSRSGNVKLPRILLKAETTRNPLFQTCDILGCLAKGNGDRKTHVRTRKDISRVHRLLFNYLSQGEGTLINIGEILICWTYFYACALCSTADPCSVKKCEHYATCVEDGGMGKCVCPQVCPLNFMPVCGSDGKIYDNVCLMEAASCSQQKKITIASKDSCSKSSNEFLTTVF